MTEKDLRNLESVRRMYAGDSAEESVLSPDIVWHVPGHNPVSGTYQGFAEYTEVMPSRMAPLTRWEFHVEEVMPNGDYVATIFRFQGERNGREVDLRGTHLMRLDDHGRVVEGWGFTSDQDQLDAFFSDSA
ncbi:MAG TPA: nuclear transport factor 2 family protein [Acidimicrobiia bacterium]|jgi:hypothetical protein